MGHTSISYHHITLYFFNLPVKLIVYEQLIEFKVTDGTQTDEAEQQQVLQTIRATREIFTYLVLSLIPMMLLLLCRVHVGRRVSELLWLVSLSPQSNQSRPVQRAVS